MQNNQLPNIRDFHLPRIEQRRMAQFFTNCCRFFKEHNIHVNAAHGTLLGLVRDKDLLAHDDDIDYEIHHEEMEKILLLFADRKSVSFKHYKTSVHFALEYTNDNQYSLHDVKNHKVKWPFCDLFVTDKAVLSEETTFKLSKNDNRKVQVFIPLNSVDILNKK